MREGRGREVVGMCSIHKARTGRSQVGGPCLLLGQWNSLYVVRLVTNGSSEKEDGPIAARRLFE